MLTNPQLTKRCAFQQLKTDNAPATVWVDGRCYRFKKLESAAYTERLEKKPAKKPRAPAHAKKVQQLSDPAAQRDVCRCHLLQVKRKELRKRLSLTKLEKSTAAKHAAELEVSEAEVNEELERCLTVWT